MNVTTILFSIVIALDIVFFVIAIVINMSVYDFIEYKTNKTVRVFFDESKKYVWQCAYCKNMNFGYDMICTQCQKKRQEILI